MWKPTMSLFVIIPRNYLVDSINRKKICKKCGNELEDKMCNFCKNEKELKLGNVIKLRLEKIENKKIKLENKYNICECGNKKMLNSKYCKKCNKIKYRKVERPSYDILIKEVKDYGYCKIGRKYGVSDNCIKKWIYFYEKNM